MTTADTLLREGLAELVAFAPPPAFDRAVRVHHRIQVARRKHQAVAGAGAALTLMVTGVTASRYASHRNGGSVVSLSAVPQEDQLTEPVVFDGGRARLDPPGGNARAHHNVHEARAAIRRAASDPQLVDSPNARVVFGRLTNATGADHRPVWAMVVTGVPSAFVPVPGQPQPGPGTERLIVVIDDATGSLIVEKSEAEVGDDVR